MTNREDEHHCHDDADGQRLVQEYRLDAPLDKVWRAISIQEFRQHWLPDLDLASPTPLRMVEGREVHYVMREHRPPYLASEVALRIDAASDGGTVLTIVQTVCVPTAAANDDSITFMCAA